MRVRMFLTSYSILAALVIVASIKAVITSPVVHSSSSEHTTNDSNGTMSEGASGAVEELKH